MRDPTSMGGEGRSFPTTSWSLVREATDRSSPEWKDKLGGLLTRYWKPVYCYIRTHWKKSNEEAKDLTQGFLALLLQGNFLEARSSEHGTLRGYLKTALGHFLVDEQRKSEALKRGGEFQRLSMDHDDVREDALSLASASPEAAFDRHWVLTCLAEATGELERTLEGSGRAVHFQAFLLYYPELNARRDPGALLEPTYDEIGRRLGLNPSEVSQHLALARRTFRTILKERISEYSGSELDAAAEFRFVLGD